jgi:hypothetical protein
LISIYGWSNIRTGSVVSALFAEAYLNKGDKEKVMEHFKNALSKDFSKEYTADIIV